MLAVILFNSVLIFLVLTVGVLGYLAYNINRKVKEQAEEIESNEGAHRARKNLVATLSEENAKYRVQVNRLDNLLGDSFPLRLNAGRSSGRTTRLTAYYIDLLFNLEEPVKVKDHHNSEKNLNDLINRIKKRVKAEHGLRVVVKGGNTLTLKAQDDKFKRAEDQAEKMGLKKAIKQKV